MSDEIKPLKKRKLKEDLTKVCINCARDPCICDTLKPSDELMKGRSVTIDIIDDPVLPDTQAQHDGRGITIQKVGVTNLRLPIIVKTQFEHARSGVQQTIGTFKATVEVPGNQKGTHMSQIISHIYDRTKRVVSIDALREITNDLKKDVEELNASKAHIELDFTYFIWNTTPFTKIKSPVPVEVAFIVSDYHADRLRVKTPVMTCCPCSVNMCEGKAHNQRCYVTIEVEANDWVWIEDLVKYSEEAASVKIHTVLRRSDEREVVLKAHRNPKFVEDVIRDVKELLDRDKRIDWYKIEVESMESIHAHNAYAELECERGTEFHDEDIYRKLKGDDVSD